MNSFAELHEYIQKNIDKVTLREIIEKTWSIWHTMRDNHETLLDVEFYESQMLSWYIICCETRRISPVSGY